MKLWFALCVAALVIAVADNAHAERASTRGCGGGQGERVVQYPEQTLGARWMFQDIVSGFPQTPSAAIANYDIAMISDYCLKDTKATQRLSLLRGSR